ncbi:MAG: T9SS type A sorting domain-containing protein [Candidatus Krumholzibacteria bacterium]|nr:T9SS type A sorting domain-containing protein [Candidatus Krumholzibacteria bacterium]
MRQTIGIVVSCIATICIHPPGLLASTIHVNPGDQIGAAVAGAAVGDTVLVHCGTYSEQGVQMGSGVTLRSETGDPDCVVIETDGTNPILTCEGLIGTTRIEGFTFTVKTGGMTIPVSRGAGVYIKDAAPIVSNCIFLDLRAGYGGAVYCGNGAVPTFSGCSFERNSAVAVGGALNCVGSSGPVMVNCLFVGNWAEGGGDVINASQGAQPWIISCTLADNGVQAGGAASLLAWNAGTIKVNNSIVFNQQGQREWTGDFGSVPTVACSDFSNWPGLLADQNGQNGNFSADPLFCGGASSTSHYSLDELSPCVAAATMGCGRVGAFQVGCAVSGVEEIPGQNIALVTMLRGNYPNPFNPSTTIRYNLQTEGRVEIAIYDMAGRCVRRLVDDVRPAGSHEVLWNGKDHEARACGTGVYFVRYKTKHDLHTSRLSLIK